MKANRLYPKRLLYHKAISEEYPVCNGSGRIVKNKTIVIKINSFEG